ncbi:MAG: polysaccharide deacetylase family protein [Verrucomicrobiota bacterium]
MTPSSSAVDSGLRVKAVLCLMLFFAVLGPGLWHLWKYTPWSSFVPPAPLLATDLPGAAVEIPQAPLETSQIAIPRTIVLRAAPNCPDPADAAATAQRLARDGVRRVLLQFKQDETDEFEGGSLFFPSPLAPVAAGFEDGRLLRFAEAMAAAGIEVCAWVPLLHDPAAARLHPEWQAQNVAVEEEGHALTGWWSRSKSGRMSKTQPGWLCPRHPDVRRYEATIVRAAVESCRPFLRGVYVDFIRFDDDFSCVCPRCLGETAKLAGKKSVKAGDLPAALANRSSLWKAWTAGRGDAIREVADTMRNAIEEVAPDLWLGACVLPFSANDYRLNTQSGQDLTKLCLAGVDEIMLMGYWDDWALSPGWLAESLRNAERQTHGEARVSCVLDGDMSVQRTMATLDALRDWKGERAFFHYGAWRSEVLAGLRQAEARLAEIGRMPSPASTALVVRIDTEPDSNGSYEKVNPEMIRSLLRLFAEEDIPATFVTCGRLAEIEPEVILEAHRAGHEIAVHAYDHEQLDERPDAEQIAIVDRSLAVFRRLGVPISGFAAPRNSITPAVRDRLIAHGLLWDGSEAYDPQISWLNAEAVASSTNDRAGIVVLPFIVPNDWDARHHQHLSAPEMAAAWETRLVKTIDTRTNLFVLGIHQWIVAEPGNLDAVRRFIRFAKTRRECRFVTAREAARQVLAEGARADGLAWRWNDAPEPFHLAR